MASWQQVPFYVVELSADPLTIESRVRKKRPLSEADFEVYEKLQGSYQPPAQPTLKILTDQLSIEQQAQSVITHCKDMIQS